jgi:hypothetical protein
MYLLTSKNENNLFTQKAALKDLEGHRFPIPALQNAY